jgi:N-ethylmaleimide reductase
MQFTKKKVKYFYNFAEKLGAKSGFLAPHFFNYARKSFKGVLISAGGYSPETAKEAVESGLSDAVAFGRLYISNPDLVRRVKEEKELNKYDRATFYGGAEKGYTDYNFLT